MWTLCSRTTAGIGMTSIRWAPSRSGIAYPHGAARLCRTFLRSDAGEAFLCSDAGKAGQPSSVAGRGGQCCRPGWPVLFQSLAGLRAGCKEMR